MFSSTQLTNNYQDEHSYEKRKIESQNIIDKYPDMVPIIIQSSHLKLKCKKYLLPDRSTIGWLLMKLRKDCVIDAQIGVYLYIENTVHGKKEYILPRITQMISETYIEYKNDDGFLYVIVESERTFG